MGFRCNSCNCGLNTCLQFCGYVGAVFSLCFSFIFIVLSFHIFLGLSFLSLFLLLCTFLLHQIQISPHALYLCSSRSTLVSLVYEIVNNGFSIGELVVIGEPSSPCVQAGQ